MKKRITYLSSIIFSMFLTFPVYAYETVTCGKIKKIPLKVLEISNLVVDIMQVAVPIILILLGMVDFIKAISSQNEDNIKKAQGLFIKRLIVGALVFFVFVIVKMLISFVAEDSEEIMNCVNCFINGPSDTSCKAS